MTTVIRQNRTTVVVPSAPVGTPGPPGPPGTGSTIGVKDEGTLVSTTVERVNFAGAGVSVTGSGADVTVTIPGGGSVVTPQQFGAVGDGTTNDGAAFVAAIAALKAYASNYGNHYGGSPKLLIPAGHYYLGTTTLDINHTLIIEGEGSGQQGVGAYGATRLRWAAGASGIRTQFPNTSGNTTVDGSFHDGSGGVVLKHLCLQGGYSGSGGAEGDYHALVIRKTAFCEDLYVINWQGEGVKAWAGTIASAGGQVVGGDASCSRLTGVKTENCRGGIDLRGTDANVITLLGCQAYTNRQFGYLDDNGSASNTNIGMHCAGNGLNISGQPATQCWYSGKVYAAKYGVSSSALAANPPTGTTADNAYWLYIRAGSVAPENPDHASGGPFRWGGDYLTINSAGVYLINCYSEGGGFSQFNSTTEVIGGEISDIYFRGGLRSRPEFDGHTIIRNDFGVAHHLVCQVGATAQYDARDTENLALGSLQFGPGASVWQAKSTALLQINGVTKAYLAGGNWDIAAGLVYTIGGVQVVGARQTGTAANATDLATAIALVNDLKAKLVAHGLIS